MARFDSGVKEYIVGSCEVKVHFPVDFRGNADITCKQCPYLSSNERMCQLNKMPVAYPNKYVGDYCPLEREEKENVQRN